MILLIDWIDMTKYLDGVRIDSPALYLRLASSACWKLIFAVFIVFLGDPFLFLFVLSVLFSLTVPTLRWAGQTQWVLSHVCITTIYSGIAPTTNSYTVLCTNLCLLPP